MSETLSLDSSSIKRLTPYYLLILAVFLFYADVYDNSFVYDDMYLIHHNPYLLSWHSLGSIFFTYINNGAYFTGYFYRPLQNLLYLLVYQTAGLSLFAFHLLNITLHAANACLVYSLGRRLQFNPLAAFLAALVWALHPIHTEAVTYMSATADPLYTLFCLSGVLVLLPDFAPRKFFIAAMFFTLGLLSKETAIIFPLLAMSCIFLLSQERLKIKTYLVTWPLWFIALIYIGVRFTGSSFSSHALMTANSVSENFAGHIGTRFTTFLATLPTYLGLLLWPSGLHMDHDFPVFSNFLTWPVGLGFVLLSAALAQITFGRARRGLPLSWGFLWFLSAQIPHTGLLFPVNALLLEHWMYLPSVGLFLGAAETISKAIQKPLASYSAVILAVILALVLGFLTWEQNMKWHDPLVFYSNILKYNSRSVNARTNLSIAYMEEGDYERAKEQLVLGLKDDDENAALHLNMAVLLAQEPDRATHIEEEIAQLKRALEINPNLVPAYKQLANCYDYLGDKNKAAASRAKADESLKKFFP